MVPKYSGVVNWPTVIMFLDPLNEGLIGLRVAERSTEATLSPNDTEMQGSSEGDSLSMPFGTYRILTDAFASEREERFQCFPAAAYLTSELLPSGRPE